MIRSVQRIVPLSLLLLLVLATAAGAQERPRVIVLGFDGVDPGLTQQYIDGGRLPHMKALAESGSFGPLGTSNPAESPVSWASFTTGQGPGWHGIFDFLRREPGTYYPVIALATATTEPLFPSRLLRAAVVLGLALAGLFLLFGLGRLLRLGTRPALALGLVGLVGVGAVAGVAMFRWVPYELPKAVSNRDGTPFWDRAAQGGVRVTAIDIPVSFPAAAEEGVQLTTGLGTPDIRQTWGNWSVYSSQSYDTPYSETAGNLKHVIMNGDVGRTTLRGPRNFTAEGEPEVDLPLTLTRLAGDRMRVEVQGETVELGVGEWSDWVRLGFRLTPLVKLSGMTRFKLLDMEPDFHLYQEPLNFDPYHLPPTVNISYPREFARQMAEAYGLRETLGWSIATNPLKDDAIDIDTFLEDLHYVRERRERVIRGELAKDDWDLFIGVFLSTDRMQHMMYRFIDPAHPFYDPDLASRYGEEIPKIYEEMDRIVGDVMRDHVDENTLLLVISDHGFHSFRRGVNLNTWLVKNGLMGLKGMGAEANYQRLEDFLDPEGRFFQNVDWSQTQAYCLGLGAIYLNLRGREQQGAVNPSEYEAVRDRIVEGLLALEDPAHPGEPVVRAVFKREDIFQGPKLPLAPDLFVGFEDGYRISWQTSAGGIPPEVFEDNLNNWSGDHCSVAPEISAGILFANRPLADRPHHIMDIAPTVLRIFGQPVPEELEGHSLLD